MSSQIETMFNELSKIIKNGNHNEISKIVNEALVNINTRDKEGYLPIASAVEHGDVDIVKYLVQQGANYDIEDIVIYAVYSDSIEMVKYVVEELGGKLDVEDDYGNYPIHIATYINNFDIVKYLIDEKGIDVNMKTIKYETPIFDAVRYEEEDIVEYLLNKGAKVNIENSYGITPLHLVAEVGNLHIAQLLVNRCANTKVKDEDNNTPYDIAKKNRNYKVYGYLAALPH